MHNVHTVEPLCRLCRSNGLFKGEIIAENDDAYLVESLFGTHNYLIIPSAHTESVSDLPDTWWVAMKELIPNIPNLTEDYNISLNIGHEAGQTIKHLHFWIVPRFAGQAASAKGLAGLVEMVNTAEGIN